MTDTLHISRHAWAHMFRRGVVDALRQDGFTCRYRTYDGIDAREDPYLPVVVELDTWQHARCAVRITKDLLIRVAFNEEDETCERLADYVIECIKCGGPTPV